jgi:hypothetical protein
MEEVEDARMEGGRAVSVCGRKKVGVYGMYDSAVDFEVKCVDNA